MNLTRDGVRRGFLVADTAFSYQEEGRLRLRNLNITFLDESGREQGQLRGREGEYHFESGDVRVNGDVEVVEATGSKRLLTERYAEAEFLISDYTYMGRVDDSRGTSIHLYKHRVTREYVCIDGFGYLRQLRRGTDGSRTWVVLQDPAVLLERFRLSSRASHRRFH